MAVVGSGRYSFEVDSPYGATPPGCELIEVAGVAVDAQDRLFVFNRGPQPVAIFSPQGEFLSAWGEDCFVRAHGITIGPDQTAWLTDDLGHAVYQYTLDGRLLQTLGTPGVPSETGVVGWDYRTIRQPAGPFHKPTNVAIAADGSLFITDGYGNARVHHFTSDGKLLASWGSGGTGPGEFQVPHGIAIDRQGRIVVADRENSRIQRFDRQGKLLDIWLDVARPMQVVIDPEDRVWVAEVGWHAGLFPWQTAPSPDAPAARISVFSDTGVLLGRFGASDPEAPGGFFAPHDLCLDSRGNVYVGEVARSANSNPPRVSANCHVLQRLRPRL